ncbi:MAG: hypothetical protein OSJ51_11880 [Parabacteroides distasonis]|nr:hypothetical protein [Parabacteroides distasonis]
MSSVKEERAAFSCGWIASCGRWKSPDIIRDGLEGLRDDLSGREARPFITHVTMKAMEECCLPVALCGYIVLISWRG